MPDALSSGSVPSRLMAQAARRFADRIALRYGAKSWTFAAFDRAVAAIASALAARFEPGSRIALFMANRPEYLFLQCAIERAGLVRVPINGRATKHDVELILEDCRPSAIFFDALAKERAAVGPSLWHVAVDDGLPDMLATPIADHLLDKASLDDLCSINYTSGSSGRPKGVMLTHRNWAAVYRNILIDRDVRGDDVIAHIGPLTHASGAYFAPWSLRGACNVVLEHGTIDGLLEAIDRFHVTVFTCVPTILTRVVNHPRLASFNLASLRMIGYGAEPIPRNTLDKALDHFGPILVQNYGLTEAMMTCATLSAADHMGAGEPRVGCIGRPYTFVEIVLRDEAGQPVKAGEVGEITVRADHVMRGYWEMPEETAQILRDGWLWSGDLARMDEEGFITLTGRSKDMLISGGFNIYPQEIEAALTSCEDVIEAAVIGEPDPNWGEIAIAFVALAPGSARSAHDITASVKDRLGIRTPKRIEIIATLPKNANGKVDKKQLKARMEAARSEA